MYTYEYPRPAVTVDCIVLRKNYLKTEILLIQRANNPYINMWALPGGFVDMDENIDTAAYRELKEETNITAVELQQFKTYGSVDRDPRGRTISIVYYSMLIQSQQAIAQDDAKEVEWFDIDKLPDLAFDHEQIITEYLHSNNI